MRAKSKYIVRVFNPDNEPSVRDMLSKEQASDPKITSVTARWRYGLVTTPKGVFCITEDGYGPNRTIAGLGAPIHFFKGDESRSFATAIFSLADCESLMTGESLSLDEFIGAQHDVAFTTWERRLSR